MGVITFVLYLAKINNIPDGQSVSSYLRVEPFAALFWALGVVVLANTWPCPPARHHSIAVHKACPYMVIIGSILKENALPPSPFLSIYVYNLSMIPGYYTCSKAEQLELFCLAAGSHAASISAVSWLQVVDESSRVSYTVNSSWRGSYQRGVAAPTAIHQACHGGVCKKRGQLSVWYTIRYLPYITVVYMYIYITVVYMYIYITVVYMYAWPSRFSDRTA